MLQPIVSVLEPPIIPEFTLLRPIGRGAYGEVWLARSVTGVLRAVKIVRRASFQEDRPFEREFAGIRRFEPVSASQETQVGVLHVGRNEEAGFFYYVMVLADDLNTGEEIVPESYTPKTLKALRGRCQRLPAAECLDIGIALSRALAHLHAHGLVHRDIKPSNVIFVHGVPKLADIGLVADADATHSFVGTEGFVPPEGAGTVSADIFSLGKVLYEISTGQDRHLFPKLPDELDRLPDVRALLELNEVMLKACDATLAHRYGSAQAMHEDLLLLKAGKSVRHLHVMERRLALVARYGVGVTLILALAVAGFLWASAQTRKAHEHFNRAEAQCLRAEHAEAEAVSRLHAANLNWARAKRLTGRPGQRYASLDELAQAARRTNSLDLRNEAIASLTLPDLRPLKHYLRAVSKDVVKLGANLNLYATNDPAGNLILRATDTDLIQFELPAQGAPATSVLFSPDDRFIATADQAGRAWLWDSQDLRGQQHSRILAPRALDFPSAARLSKFTPDSRQLVVRHPDGSLHFLNTSDGSEERVWSDQFKADWLLFDPSGEFFACGRNNQVFLYRTADGRREQALTRPFQIMGVAWHPDGRRLALALARNIEIWEIREARRQAVLEGHDGTVIGVAFTESGEWLASASWDNTTRLWDTATHREVLRLPDSGNGLRISADDRRLAFDSWDTERVQLYELPPLRTVQRCTVPPPTQYFDNHTGPVAFCPHSDLFAAIDREGVYLFRPLHPEPVALLPTISAANLQFDPEGHTLFVAGREGLVRWPMTWSADRTEVRIGPPDTVPATRGQAVSAFTLPTDQQRLVLFTKAGLASFNLAQPDQDQIEPIFQFKRRVAFSDDGLWVAAQDSARGSTAEIWNTNPSQLLTNLPAGLANAMAFSPDRRWFACASAATTTFWRTADWSLRYQVLHHQDSPGRQRLTFSHDSRMVAVSVSDTETKLILSDTGEELATLPTGQLLNSLAFSPDGDRLAASCEPGDVQVWDLRRLRAELAAISLDWPGPASPSPRLASTKSVRVVAAPER